jgi:DASS family divalent anion:Na+ symporter
VPYILFRVVNPEIKKTPDAPQHATDALEKMGKMSRGEWLTLVVFICMVLAWAFSSELNIDKTAVAFLGLGILMLASIYTSADLRKEGEALSIWVWFAILYTLSTFLNEFGFMVWLGEGIAMRLEVFSVPVIYVSLIIAYVLLHYLFVSQTAQMLALYGVFLSVGITSGVNPALMAYMLLFATNFFAAITPQGSSANVLFAGSGYLKVGKLYKYGGVVTLANTVIYLAIGTPWILFVT